MICKIKHSVRNYREVSPLSLALISIVTLQLKNLEWFPIAQLIKLRFLWGAHKTLQSLALPGPPPSSLTHLLHSKQAGLLLLHTPLLQSQPHGSTWCEPTHLPE